MEYEEVYLEPYSNRLEAKDGLEAYSHFYNTQMPHQALGYRRPAEVCDGRRSGQRNKRWKGAGW